MKNYYQVRLGKGGAFAEECFAGNFIGTDFEIPQDLSADLPDEWRAFNRKFVPIFLASHPHKTKIGAGLACGSLWTVSKGIQRGDVVLCPDSSGNYRLGEVTGDYYYMAGTNLPHRRGVRWLTEPLPRAGMSPALQSPCRSIGTVTNLTEYADEIERLYGGSALPALVASDPTVEDAAAFAMEKHLEDFLVQNWEQTELGREFDIYEDEGERVGQQYQTDTGPMDVLAISKDRKRLLVVELKKGRASDAVVGQVMRYMGFVKEELAEPGQTVHGVIIAEEQDQRIRRALAVVPNITFYRYQVSFKLLRA